MTRHERHNIFSRRREAKARSAQRAGDEALRNYCGALPGECPCAELEVVGTNMHRLAFRLFRPLPSEGYIR